MRRDLLAALALIPLLAACGGSGGKVQSVSINPAPAPRHSSRLPPVRQPVRQPPPPAQALADQALSEGPIVAVEVLSVRHDGWDEGHIDANEADAMFVLNEHLKHTSPEWVDFFVEAIGEFVVNGTEPKGYVSDEQAAWLSDHVDRDGRLDSMAELELLVRI